MTSAEIDNAFATFMQRVLPTVPRDSVKWYTVKQGFIGGLGIGMGIPPFEGISDVLTQAWELCNAALLFAAIPPEGRCILPNGEKGINELGIIHLTTAMEEADPDDAERIRNIRYYLQKMKQGGNPNP